MREVILLKYGELILKGLNRHVFEEALMKNIKRRLYKCGAFTVTSAQSTVYVEPEGDTFDMDMALERLRKIFGIVSLARACVVEKSMEAIDAAAVDYLRGALENVAPSRWRPSGRTSASPSPRRRSRPRWASVCLRPSAT